ncbi:ATP-dependent sacrificial sulfur transferase LarE [Synechococcus sp. RSCCF101]|uniref:ATP-dependent sacrificial sulfur transferase LarE n=1 Tax=Synechococcus sp. RSCCF101 TaxID=2511069 RepID=UPI001244C061|nr:ATP-dependent sacrificial sulfur transferase LarE [Synechococcus sp. RSCCF101]QEY32157.1 ATP-dependent sacrificial sulfur transferase LarE [Synechococcus sp. RSCCF101]
MTGRSGGHPLVEHLEAADLESLRALRDWMLSHDRLCIAYSGGVDSTLVAAIAAEQLGERALAVTGVSPALAEGLRRQAGQQAGWLGIRHREVGTQEWRDPAYSSNPSHRCYACKSELHRVLAAIAGQAGPGAQVVDGVNADDLGEHRPGIAAAREHGVRSPLAELTIRKASVRAISRALGFPWWDKPAQPCLASRFPYGEPISPDGLDRVGRAEALLEERGFRRLRVRSQGDTARIELSPGELARALELWSDSRERAELVTALRGLGFTAVSLDLEGLVSGKLNRSLPGPPGSGGS